jgi:peptidoglycan/xylan/chitin deacetylase (PgdA/CDA1 family)
MGDDVLVLCYHAVSRTWRQPLAVTPQGLERQLTFLVDRGYRGVTFHEVVTSRPTGRTLAVTFDDAFRSVWQLAVPILSRLGLPGTIFVPTSFPGSKALRWPGIEGLADGQSQDELAPMSWDELRQAAALGWEIGSHTRTHPRLTQLADRELEDELRRSREDCETMIGCACRSIAYPYGDHDSRVVAIAGGVGYVAGATLPDRLGPAAPLRWPRLGVYPPDAEMFRFRAKVSAPLRRLRATGAWSLVTRARAAESRAPST